MVCRVLKAEYFNIFLSKQAQADFERLVFI
jgi:hypothetical protein